MKQTKRIPPKDGQESVWDYPRPPALEQTNRHVIVKVNGRIIAESRTPFRILETSHPPVYYVDPEDVDMSLLAPNDAVTFCEWKGEGRYYDIVAGDDIRRQAAWYYPTPTPAFEAIRNFIAFYPGRVDECTLDGQRVQPQEGNFYGGWITPEIVGPFKGAPGTWGW